MYLKLLCKGCGYCLGETDALINLTRICEKCGSATKFVTSGPPRDRHLEASLLHEGEGAADLRLSRDPGEQRKQELRRLDRAVRENRGNVDPVKCR